MILYNIASKWAEQNIDQTQNYYRPIKHVGLISRPIERLNNELRNIGRNEEFNPKKSGKLHKNPGPKIRLARARSIFTTALQERRRHHRDGGDANRRRNSDCFILFCL